MQKHQFRPGFHAGKSPVRFSLKPLAALLPLFAAHSLHAQQALDPVVVTATRFQSAVADAPIAAQVITREEIRDSAATTVSEVLNKLGGVHTRISFTGIPDSPLDLRGFGMTGSQNTLVLLNGMRMSESDSAAARLSAIPIDSIERIEILRGAGAVLYGSGATGGTINIITRSPVTAGVGGNALVLAGSYGLRDARAGIQAGNGALGLRLNAQHYEKDGYRANNRAELNAVSGELRLGGHGEFLAFHFGADQQKARLPGVRTHLQLASDPRGTGTPDDYMDSDSTNFALRGEKRFGDVILAFDIGRRDKSGSTFGSVAGIGTSSAEIDADVTTFSPRLLWMSRIGGADNRLTVGADWSEWSYTNRTLGTGWMSSQNQLSEQKNQAIYFRDELSFSGGTRVSVGARRENVRQSDADSLTPRPRTAVEHRLSAHELALQQDFGAGYSAYGRLGRSFRVANIDENRCLFAPCTPNLLKPQRSSDREVGIQWQGKSAQLRIGVYEMDIDDEIHYNAYTGANSNLPPTRRRGLEVEGKLAIGKTVDLAARYDRIQSRFRGGTFTGFDSDLFFAPFSADLAGKTVPLVPEDRVSLNLGWQATAATRLAVNLTYVGSQRYDNDQANRFRQMPSYTVTDIKVSHDMGAWRIAAGINNLFDKAYYSYAVTNISASPTRYNAYPEDRRNAYVSAEYRF